MWQLALATHTEVGGGTDTGSRTRCWLDHRTSTRTRRH
jgi:hypothetical protein